MFAFGVAFMKMKYRPPDPNGYPFLGKIGFDFSANRPPRALRALESLLEKCDSLGVILVDPILEGSGGSLKLLHQCQKCGALRKTPTFHVAEKIRKGRPIVCQSCASSKKDSGAPAEERREPTRIVTCASRVVPEPGAFPLLEKYSVDFRDYKAASWKNMERILAFLEEKGIAIDKPAFVKKPPSMNSYVRYRCPICGDAANSMSSSFFKKFIHACRHCSAKKINEEFKTESEDSVRERIEAKGFSVVSFWHRTQSESEWTVKCGHGHEFSMPAARLLRDLQFCPHCHKSSIEQELLKVLVEALYGKSFPTAHPPWLVNEETGFGLELDLLNEELGLAFEYHGPQHYLPIYGEERLKVSLRNDSWRRAGCERRGVRLVEIRFVDKNSQSEAVILELLAEALRGHGIDVPPDLPASLVGTADLNVPVAEKMMEEAREKLASMGKELLGGRYVNSKSMIRTRCGKCGFEREQSIRALLWNHNSDKGCVRCHAKARRARTEESRSKEALAICEREGWEFMGLRSDIRGVIVGFECSTEQGLFSVGRKMLLKLRKKEAHARTRDGDRLQE